MFLPIFSSLKLLHNNIIDGPYNDILFVEFLEEYVTYNKVEIIHIPCYPNMY